MANVEASHGTFSTLNPQTKNGRFSNQNRGHFADDVDTPKVREDLCQEKKLIQLQRIGTLDIFNIGALKIIFPNG